ncbi:TRAP transporter small permease [Georgenia sp. AZ-5]|uniref:TRAP transporter small permease n=1 Tax=Georgenia sp. AZ-5 TaxID=3367526 RepID=UPI003754960E
MSDTLAKTRSRLTGAITLPAAIAVLILMGHTIVNAAMRAAGHPIEGTLEISSYWWMPLIAFLGFVTAQQRHEHIDVTIAFDRMPARFRPQYVVMAEILVIAMSAFIAWYSLQEALMYLETRRASSANGTPIWPMSFTVPIGYGLLIVHIVLTMIERARGKAVAAGGSGTLNEVTE